MIRRPQPGPMTAYDTWGLPAEDDTARLVDDVNQPLAAIETGAEAALRWLQHDPPNLAEAEAALALVLENSHRAVDLVRIVQTCIQHRSAALVDMDGEASTDAAILRAAAYPSRGASSGEGSARARSEMLGLARQTM